MIRWLLYRFLPYYLIMGLVLSLGLLLFTELGLRLIWQQLEPRLPEQVSIQSVHGRLLGKLGLRGLDYQQGDNRVRVDQAWLVWRPTDLLRGRIHIEEVIVAGATIDWPGGSQAEQPAPTSRAPLPQLPDIEIGELQLRQVQFRSGSGPPVVLQKLRLQAAIEEQVFRLQTRQLAVRDWGEWALRLRGRIESDALTLTEFKLQGLADPVLHLAGEGNCDWPLQSCEGQLSWSQLRWPLLAGRWFSPSGQLRVRFRDGRVGAELDAELHGEQLPVSELQASVRQPDGSAYRLEADWRSDTGGVGLQADYSEGRVQGRWQLRDLDLAFWRPDWPSQLASSGQFRREADGMLQLDRIRAEGRLRERAFTLQADARIDGRQWAVQGLDARIGRSRLHGHLKRLAGWEGKLQLDSPDLAALYPGLNGRLALALEVAGQQALPDLRWQISAEQLGWQDLKVGQLQSRGRSKQRALQGHLELSDARLPGISVDRLRLDSTASATGGTSRLALATSLLQLELEASQNWRKDELELVLRKGMLALDADRWELVSGGGVRASAERVEVAEQCWQSQDSRSCLQLQWRDQQVEGDWQLENYNLARLSRFLPEGVRVGGHAGLTLSIPASTPQDLQLELRGRSSEILLARRFDEDDEEVLLTFAPGQLQASRRQGEIRAQWQLPLQDAAGLSGDLRLDAQQLVDGRLRLEMNQLAWLGALVPEILLAEGQVKGELAFKGPVAQPRLSGDLRLSDGRVRLDGPEIELHDLRANIRGAGDRDMDFDLHAASGDGALDMGGSFSWREQPVLDARIRGKDFLAMDSPEARVLASPDLQLALAGRDLRLTGRLVIPAARIQPRQLNAGGRKARAPSPDQVIIGEEAVAATSAYRVRARVDLVLGDDVSFSGFGLNAALGGQVNTRLVPGKPPTGVGELRLINGRYKAYGQDLQIERGRLIYSGGPLSEPGLDFRAYRQATPEIRAGVVVRGTVKNPQLSLYSEPSMRETDQLSYLVLGRAAESQSDADQAALNNAALALGLKGSDFLANRFKGKLGLDEVRIGTQAGAAASQASLVLGKYLNPDLYISYGVGLFEPVYTFRLRYQLHRRWTLETESGLESGGDIFYTIER